MSGKNLFLGIDTSNYTTSAALCDDTGNILVNCKVPLPVAEGARGLRQSDAVFHHVKNLPEAAESYRSTLREADGKLLSSFPIDIIEVKSLDHSTKKNNIHTS